MGCGSSSDAARPSPNKGSGKGDSAFKASEFSDSKDRTPSPNETWNQRHANEERYHSSEKLNIETTEQTNVSKTNPAFVKQPSELRGEIVHSRLLKGDQGLGFTISGGESPNSEFVQIKKIIRSGAADKDGILQIGDVIVYVNEHMVLGLTQFDTVDLFSTVPPGDYVDLQVCRGYPLPHDTRDTPSFKFGDPHALDPDFPQPFETDTQQWQTGLEDQQYVQPPTHKNQKLPPDLEDHPSRALSESDSEISNSIASDNKTTHNVTLSDSETDRENINSNSVARVDKDTDAFTLSDSETPRINVDEKQESMLDTSTESIEDQTSNALLGDLDMTCPASSKIVRIFTSSTFTDTKNERNMLMKHAYPKIKEHCRRIGYEFQVVDMRWGVRDEATDDHMTTELCLKEIKLCQEVSTGPNFVSLLSHKYGYIAFPRVIAASEYGALMAEIEEDDTIQLFKRWYTVDNNAVPPAYILSPISSRLPDFLSRDEKAKLQAKQTWWDESEKMQNALDVAATKVFDKDKARTYFMSVTETEVTEGLLKLENPSKHSLWFKRNIEDIEEQPSSRLLSRFIECTGPDEKWKRARFMMKQLKEDKMTNKLSADRIMSYSVKWNQTSGINPEEDKHHQAYLDTLCKDFVTKMTDMIDADVAERARSDDHLVDECCQHIRFCQSKCEGFQGRQDTLELIKTYVQGNSSEPLVLHGSSGTGKTSIMAMVVKMMKQWTAYPPALVFRFLGTSPDSSSLVPLIESLTSQIRRIYKLQPLPTTTRDLDIRIKELKKAMEMGQPDKPLILMLDSLDQLDPAYDARKLGWLIMKLAPGTKVIVSTLPEPIYDCFEALQAVMKSESSFVSVPLLDNSDVKTILDNWLTLRQRRLTDHQMTIVLDAFKKCPTPLFLKLSFEESTTWSSFVPEDKTVLQDTVRASIDFLFKKLEKAHGQLLVSRALGYMTIANNGATEAELEDILSCDDDVLNDVYTYWTPPIRRLPPLLLVRVRADLSQYLVERGADGVRVIYWYHRQFIEAAEARYCSDKVTNMLIHKRLADFFHGTWAAGEEKPYTNAKGESGTEDRHVSLQPLKFGPNKYNMRTLNNLPYHRTKAGQVELLKDQCLANPTFLVHKLEATPLISLLRDFAVANEAFQEDVLIKEVLEALHLSQKALTADARQIIPQLLLRLEDSSQATRPLLERCKEYPSTYLLPTKCVLEKPGGQLVHSISAHNELIDTMDMTADGSMVVTVCSPHETMRLWAVNEGMPKLRRELKGIGRCGKAMFCNFDQWLICLLRESMVVIDVETGVTIVTLSSLLGSSFCPLGKGKVFLMQLQYEECKLIDLLEESKEDQTQTLIHPEKIDFGGDCRAAGSENYLALIANKDKLISVFDLNSRKFLPSFSASPKFPIESITIAADESHLIYTTLFTNTVVFADFDGNKLREIPRSDNRRYKKINTTLDGSHLYLTDENAIYFIETATLQEVGKLEQHGIRMAVTHDAVNVYTVAKDGNLRIWDRSRGDKSKDSAQCVTELHSFSCVLLLNNPRYVLLCGHVMEDEDMVPHLRLEILDIFNNTTVKWGQMMSVEGEWVHCEQMFCTKSDDHVILVLKMKGANVLRMVRVDLQTMTVVKHYVGFTTKVAMSEETDEIFCTTRGSNHMKLYDKNGDYVRVMKVRWQDDKIVDIWMNTSGTVGCAGRGRNGPLIVYDLVERIHLYTIKEGETWYTLINNAGTRLMYKAHKKIAGEPIMNNVNHLVIWDIETRKEVGKLYDVERQKVLLAEDSDDNVGLDSVHELDSTRLLSTHDDNVIRVWDSQTYELLRRLPGHSNFVEVSVCDRSHYIFTYGSFDDEGCFRLWDKATYECVSSFTLDKTVKTVTWSRDGKFLASSIEHSPPDVTMWKVHSGHDRMTVDEEDYPHLFPQSDAPTKHMLIKIYMYKRRKMDGDPDSDQEEAEESYPDCSDEVTADLI